MIFLKSFVQLLLFLIIIPAYAQPKQPDQTELFNEIAVLDSLLFHAFNSQDMDRFQSFFSKDLEWFQDNGGLLPYKEVFKTFEENFKKEFKLSRKMVEGSLEVYPIKDYGAIETGQHQFSHMENGKLETHTFKFVMIWQLKNRHWKITKVISYGH
jgi:hypothetical protein